MKFGKLKIAWSVAWGVVAVLVGVLLVRSYCVADVVQWSATKWCGFQFTSSQGQWTARRCDLDGAGHHGGMDFPDWRWQKTLPGSFSTSPTHGFDLGHRSYYVAVPYWASVTSCVILALVPQLIWPKRCQFGLRTLLITTTLVAVILALAVYSI